MSSYQDKQKIRKFLHSRGMILVLFILCVILIKSTFDMYIKSREAKENKEQAIAEYQELLDREEKLTESIESFETKEGMEKSLRDTYRVAKEGEGLVVITYSDPEEGNQEPKTMGEKFDNFFDNFFAPRN